MNSNRNKAGILAAVLALAIALLYLWMIESSWAPPKYVDENGNGLIGFGEAFRGLDIIIRDAEDGCKKVFSLKDGRTLRVVCEDEDSYNQACYNRAIVFGLVCYLIGVFCLFLTLMLYFWEGPRSALLRLFFVTRDEDSIYIATILLLGIGLAFVAIGMDVGICVIV